MPKLRKRMTKDFTIICNTALRDTRLGSSERGLYCTMMSMAEDWNFSIRGFASIMPDGVTKISSALKKLEALGYLSYHMAAAMEGSSDLTHFNDTGAEAVAGLVAGGIKSAKLPLPSEVK